MTSIVNGVYKPMVYKPTALNSLREKKKNTVSNLRIQQVVPLSTPRMASTWVISTTRK